jgi:hydroxymethylpyrimidine/phosphomethylpyrimidine kinase
VSVPVALTIAGSDSSGGAGIQADLKSFSALGAYGCSVIAALTAQNTRGVQGILAVPAEFVAQQLDSIFTDLTVDAVKLGMLGEPEVIEVVAKSGHRLLADEAVDTLRRLLLPLATVITPNLPEAAVLLGEPVIAERRQMPGVAARLQGQGARNVLLKGGHLEEEESPDLLMHGGEVIWIPGRRIATPHTHGTGCSYASAIAALMARGRPLPSAVLEAKRWLDGAIEAGQVLELGKGRGPVHHFHHLWPHLESEA